MANNTLIGAIRAEATLESGKFVDGAKKIRTESKKTEVQVKQSFAGMGAAVKGFGGAITAGLSIGLLGGLAKKALDFAAAIGTTAKQLGVGTKELQEFRYAASQVGVKNAEADKALEKLGVTLGKAAAGSKTASKALGAVGITLTDINTKSRTEIFGKIADQMNKQGGAAKNAAAANAIFGESASKLTPLLDKGSRGINQLAEAANRLGIVLSDRQIQSADETARKLEDVRAVLSAQIAGVVADNAGSIVTLANALATLTSSIINFLGSNPSAALAILGGLAGARFGLPGAAAGALTGGYIGTKMGRRSELANSDLRTRAAALSKAREEALAAAKIPGRAGSMATAETRKRLLEELDATKRAIAAHRSGQGGGVGTAAIPQFLAPAGAKPRKRRAPRDRSDDVLFQFDQEQRRAEMDVLRAKMDLAQDYVERTSLSVQMLDLEKETFEAELANRVRRAERDFAEGKITADALAQAKAQADVLKAKNDEADALKRRAIIEEEEAQRREEALRLSQVDFDIQRELLSKQRDLAQTAAERRDIELRLLDLSYRQERARLEAVLADEKSSFAAQQEARNRLAALGKNYALDREAVRRSTAGPMESYLNSIPHTAAQMNEALEQLQVQGLDSLVDALSRVGEGWEAMRDAALAAIQDIIAQLIRLQLQKMLFNLIGGAMGGFGSAGFGSVVAGNSAALGGGIPLGASGGGLLPFASGGSVILGGRQGIDKNILAMNGIPFAKVSYGERATFSNDNSGGGMAPPAFVFNNYARMSPDEARRTGAQAAAGWTAEMNRARSKGIS